MTIYDKTQDEKIQFSVGIGIIQTEPVRNFYNTSDATATSSDIVVGKNAYGKYGLINGSLDLQNEKEISYEEGYTFGYDEGNQAGYNLGILDGREDIITEQSDATITPQNVLRDYIGYGKNNERIVGESDAITSIDVGALNLKFGYATFTEVPSILDFSNVTNWKSMFAYNSNLKKLHITLTGATNVEEILLQSGNADSSIILDCTGVSNLSRLLYYTYVKNVQLINAKPQGTLGNFLWFAHIERFPEMDTIGLTSANNMCQYAQGRLKYMPLLDFSNVERTDEIFGGTQGTNNEIDIKGFVNLGKGYKSGSAASYHKFDISKINVPRQSLLNIFNNMYNMNLSNVTDATIVIRAADKANLTSDELAIATNKGWIIS